MKIARTTTRASILALQDTHREETEEATRPAKKPTKKVGAKTPKQPEAKQAAAVTPRFEREGDLTWAVLAPLPAEQRIIAITSKRRPFGFDPEETRHWCVLSGPKGYAAMIDTQLGSACGETE